MHQLCQWIIQRTVHNVDFCIQMVWSEVMWRDEGHGFQGNPRRLRKERATKLNRKDGSTVSFPSILLSMFIYFLGGIEFLDESEVCCRVLAVQPNSQVCPSMVLFDRLRNWRHFCLETLGNRHSLVNEDYTDQIQKFFGKGPCPLATIVHYILSFVHVVCLPPRPQKVWHVLV